MKALEILNKINEQIKGSRDDGFAVEIHFNKDYAAEIERAIEELEDLKNRKCSNCLSKKYCDVVTQDENNFYCSDWESINERD